MIQIGMRMGVGISEVLLLELGIQLECVLRCIGLHWYGNMVLFGETGFGMGEIGWWRPF